VEGDHLLITVQANSSDTSPPEPVRHFVDIDKATKAVAEFLRDFTANTGDGR
jgi:hypothetical protein